MDAVTFEGASAQCVGVWHLPEGQMRDITIVMLHGWSGTRSGPHQMLTRAARAFANDGLSVLRFDFGGRGDSAGDAQSASLATMREDLRGALQFCRERGSEKFILLGLCSGCEVAFASASESGVAALALWSAPVFAASHSDERAARKRSHNLKLYARKLLRPATYVKALTGKLDTAAIKQATRAQGGEARNQEADGELGASGKLPRGWKSEALERFKNFRAPLLLVYGTADPTTEEALRWHRDISNSEPCVHLIEGANHSYYGLAWEREVIEKTSVWLRDISCEINADVE